MEFQRGWGQWVKLHGGYGLEGGWVWLFLAAVGASYVLVGLCSIFEHLHDLSVPPPAFLHPQWVRLWQVLMDDKQRQNHTNEDATQIQLH